MHNPRTLLSYISNASIVAKTFVSYSVALAILLAVASLSSGCANGYGTLGSQKTTDDLTTQSDSSDSSGSSY